MSNVVPILTYLSGSQRSKTHRVICTGVASCTYIPACTAQ